MPVSTSQKGGKKWRDVGLERMERIRVLVILFTFFSFFGGVYAVTQSECESGSGIWHGFDKTQPQSDDPVEPDDSQTPTGYCSCSDGWDWDDRQKECVNRLDEKCEETRGIWRDDTCTCPEDSKGYDPRFGCTYTLDEPKIDSPINRPADSTSPFSDINIISAFFGVGVLILRGIAFKRIRG